MFEVVIDASSPAASLTGTYTPDNTCASFTPPADAMFLVMWGGDSYVGNPPTGAPVTVSSPAQTWVTDVWDQRNTGSPFLDGQAAVIHALVTGSPGATTVTVSNQIPGGYPSTDSILKVFVLTGHDPINPIGQSGGGRQSSGSSLSASYTASITGSQGFLVLCDWNAGDPSGWAPMTGCTIQDTAASAGLVTFGVVRRTTADGTLGVSTTVGLTGLVTGGAYHWAYVEVVSLAATIAAAGQAGYPAHGANPPMF